MSNVKSVEIVCNLSKGEIATVIQHVEPESIPLNDREVNTTGKQDMVKIKARRFVAHSRTPRACAEAVESYARTELPGVPVSLAFC